MKVNVGSAARQEVARLVQEIFGDEEGLLDALEADGWPRELSRVGFALHRQTWNVDELADALEQELGAHAGGPLIWPRRVAHLWPALPGAGVTPVLFGMLLGIEQVVRASRRGRHFGRFFAAKAGEFVDVVETSPGEELPDAEVYVVSGSDETVSEVSRRLPAGTRLVGYGHRVSFGVLLDGGGVDLAVEAGRFARDVVLWNQRGCFSLRALVFRGDEARRDAFCAHLARAIAEQEEAWGARQGIGDGELALRAQALGRAQMSGPVYVDGLGYVRPLEGPFRGELEAPHGVTVHRMLAGAGPAELAEMVDLPREGLQGVALSGATGAERESWVRQCGVLGATRVCEPGLLQGPPAGWWHDGRPNVLEWAWAVASR